MEQSLTSRTIRFEICPKWLQDTRVSPIRVQGALIVKVKDSSKLLNEGRIMVRESDRRGRFEFKKSTEPTPSRVSISDSCDSPHRIPRSKYREPGHRPRLKLSHHRRLGRDGGPDASRGSDPAPYHFRLTYEFVSTSLRGRVQGTKIVADGKGM